MPTGFPNKSPLYRRVCTNTISFNMKTFLPRFFSLDSYTMIGAGEKNRITYWVWAETIARVNNDKTHLTSITARSL
jgi:hypothetical protein